MLDGGPGDDTLAPLGGADRVVGGDGTDTVRYATSEGGFKSIQGSAHADTLTGTEHGDRIVAGGGNDTVSGGKGNDWILGGPGGDTMNCGEGTDILEYGWSPEAVRVDLHLNQFSGKEAAGDSASNCESVSGSQYGDTLRGNAASGELRGNDGPDTLEGRGGNDGLIGGLGNDRFVFGPGHGNDTVLDFENGRDRIDVSALGITNFAGIVLRESGGSVTLDFTRNRGGTVVLQGIPESAIDDTDFAYAE